MITATVSFLFLLVLISLLRGFALELEEGTNYEFVMVISIIIIILIYMATIINLYTNFSSKEKTSKIPITPTISIKQEIQEGNVVKSDTTYTYIFENNY